MSDRRKFLRQLTALSAGMTAIPAMPVVSTKPGFNDLELKCRMSPRAEPLTFKVRIPDTIEKARDAGIPVHRYALAQLKLHLMCQARTMYRAGATPDEIQDMLQDWIDTGCPQRRRLSPPLKQSDLKDVDPALIEALERFGVRVEP
jgi:hypothetical protein